MLLCFKCYLRSVLYYRYVAARVWVYAYINGLHVWSRKAAMCEHLNVHAYKYEFVFDIVSKTCFHFVTCAQ